MISFRRKFSNLIKKACWHEIKPTLQTEVFFEVKNNVGIITLNRPQVLNCLSIRMLKSIYQYLKEWEQICSFVIIQSTGDRAFCSGGDILEAIQDEVTGKSLFRYAYTSDYYIANYSIPVVSLIDGITMGGGVGLSIHGSHRVATEHTLFAMPETKIGLSPDVGGSYFLPRLEGKLGIFLGLTGLTLTGPDVVNSGIATHFIPKQDIQRIADQLLHVNPSSITEFLNNNSVDVSRIPRGYDKHIDKINRYFTVDSVEGILDALYSDGSDWAKNIANVLLRNSPTALKITRRQLELGSKLNLRECFKMEYRLSCAAVSKKVSQDLYEGVRAVKVKDKSPKWQPSRLEEVSLEMITKAFEPLLDSEELDI